MAANRTKTIERRKLLKAPLGNWTVTSVDVRSLQFAPGQTTGVHSHPCPVVGYITEGAAIFQIDGQPEKRLTAGDAFYEPAAARIARFDNASAEQPLHFVALYLMNGNHPLIEMME